MSSLPQRRRTRLLRRQALPGSLYGSGTGREARDKLGNVYHHVVGGSHSQLLRGTQRDEKMAETGEMGGVPRACALLPVRNSFA